MKVVKFGGSSLASAEAVAIAKDIVLMDANRTFIVVSAPGKCKKFPRKVTDLLIEAFAEMQINEKSESLEKVFGRFRELANETGVEMENEIQRTYEEVHLNRNSYDFVISRGEYLMAILFAKILGYKFIDAANYIVIKKSGRFHETATLSKFNRCIVKGEKIVMGGFYGSSVDGGVRTFPRGGSDYSGAIAAVCMKASVYENFTDTYGVQTANPAIIKNTKSIAELDFRTMHKLSIAGASVIYPDCIPLLRSHAVPLKVDNTFDSGKSFTRIGFGQADSKYFCITYKFEQNINKDTVFVLCMFNKLKVEFQDLRRLLKYNEVYLVKLDKKGFTLITDGANLNTVIDVLHEYFLKL